MDSFQYFLSIIIMLFTFNYRGEKKYESRPEEKINSIIKLKKLK